MKPGVSISETIARPCVSHRRMKRAALSAASASIAPPRCSGLLARMPIGRPPRRASTVCTARPKPARSSIALPRSTSPSMTRRMSWLRVRCSGSTLRSASASGASPCTIRPVSRDSSRFVAATAAASSSTSRSITPLADCTAAGPMSSGAKRPRPPPSIIAGPPMPMLLPRVATIRSQQPSSAALPAKQRPAAMPSSGTRPDRRAKLAKVGTCRPATMGMSVSPGRPPPPSANSTSGRRSSCAMPSSRSVFWWLRRPCVPASTVAS